MSSLFDFDKRPDSYAVMGNPVQHSKSPRIHALFAAQTRQRMEYTAIQVDPGGFVQAVRNFQANDGKGLNITVPFKREAWQLVDERTPRAEQAGAVNTISIGIRGELYGDNTDGVGLMRDLVHNHNIHFEKRSVLLLGAGGAARGVVGPLLKQKPARLLIANRTADRAEELAGLFSSHGPVAGCGFEALTNMKFDLIINATSASLHGELLPLPETILTSATCCYDMMYGPEQTPFLKWAASLGADLCLDGLGMLVEQAAESFAIWRGVRPDTDVVIETIRQEIQR